MSGEGSERGLGKGGGSIEGAMGFDRWDACALGHYKIWIAASDDEGPSGGKLLECHSTNCWLGVIDAA